MQKIMQIIFSVNLKVINRIAVVYACFDIFNRACNCALCGFLAWFGCCFVFGIICINVGDCMEVMLVNKGDTVEITTDGGKGTFIQAKSITVK